MGLSNDLILKFVKETNDDAPSKKETIVFGNVTKVQNGKPTMVKIDGAEDSTPVSSTVKAEVGNRVVITIKNHNAIISGNLGSPSVIQENVDGIEKQASNASEAASSASQKANEAYNKVVELDTLLADKVSTKEFYAEIGRVENLIADSADITELTAEIVKVKRKLTANEGDFFNLTGDYVTVEQQLNANSADIVDLKASTAKIGNLEADVADINTLIFGSATGNVIQTSFSNAVIAQLGDAQIKSAMIESISAGKITAGDIVTNNVRVKSEDGSLIISDETLQISDGTRVRVQIGKDAASDYSINVWDQNGNLMFSKGGITDAAIKEAIIRNDMVSDTANIHASKLDIDSLFEEINEGSNTIKSTKVYLDEKKQTLDVAFKSLTTEVSEQGQTISSQGTAISTIQGQISSKIWQQDINTAKNEMSTRYSTLEQEVDGFKTTVSETYATVSDLDNIEIGGRNLLLNTGNNGQVKFINDAASTTSSTIQSYRNNQGHVTLTASTDTEEIYYRFMVPNQTNLYGIEPGKTYTFSGKAKTTTSSGTLTQLMVRTQHSIGSGWTGGASHIITTEDTDEWVPFVKTFKIPETASGYYISIQLFYGDTWDGTIELKDLKIENGNKATAWTPAPEDIDAEITNLDARILSAESSITQLTNKITANVTETTNLGTRMTTVEQTAHSLSVEVENLEIGGTNLLPNTKEKPQLNGAGLTSGQDSHLGFSVAYYDNSAGTGTKDVSGLSSFFTPEPNTEYTLSFYAKGSGIMNSFLYPSAVASGYSNEGKKTTSSDGVLSHTLTNNWKKYVIVWKTTSDITGVKHILPMRLNAGAIGYICGVKFEKGNRATDWSPAPEDIESDILDASKTATNYLSFSSSGLVIGDMTASTLGKNVLIDSDSVDIRNGATTLASFGADYLYLAKNSRNATIDLCNGLAKLYHQSRLSYDTLFVIETPNATEIRGTSDPLCVTSTVASKPAIKFANADGVLGSIGMVASGTESYITRNHPSTAATYSILDTGNYYKLMDSGWFNGGVLGDSFTVYNDNSQVKYRKIGKQVQIMGTVKPRVDIAGSTDQHTIFTLPSGYRPPYAMHQVCYGSNNYTWRLTVNTNGTVCFSRYGLDSGYVTAAVGHWINFQATFFID